jgi:hypothetical protein
MIDTILYELNELTANLDAFTQSHDITGEQMIIGLVVVMALVLFTPKMGS